VEKAGALTGGREARGIGGRGARVEEVVVRGRPSGAGSVGQSGWRRQGHEGERRRVERAGRRWRVEQAGCVGRGALGSVGRSV
jgi:hypothetical protein